MRAAQPHAPLPHVRSLLHKNNTHNPPAPPWAPSHVSSPPQYHIPTPSISSPSNSLNLLRSQFQSIGIKFKQTNRNKRNLLTEAMSTETYRYMGRSFSDVAGDSSGAFSDCNSDRSGEFPTSATSLHRLVLSSDDHLIHDLIADLDSPDLDSQRRAAMELRLLAKHNSENRLKIAASGAVKPLVSLLSSPDSLLQEHAATAILNLSLCDDNKTLIAASGAIKPLIFTLKAGTAAAKENAACALLRLSQIEDHKLPIGRSGAIPHLINLLETGGHRGKKDASTALYAICSCKENKIRAIEAGIVRPLLDLMADPESGMVDKAAYVLHTVAGAAEGRRAAVEEGGIPVLVEIVEVGTQRQKEIATATLLMICEESVVYRTMVAREGAIPPLVALSQSGTARAKQKAEALIELLRQPRPGSTRGKAVEGSD